VLTTSDAKAQGRALAARPLQAPGWVSFLTSRIVPFSGELKQTEIVSEWIAHAGLSPPTKGLNLSFKCGPSGHGPPNSTVDICDFKVDMDRSSVAAVVVHRRSFLRWSRAGALQHQVNLR